MGKCGRVGQTTDDNIIRSVRVARSVTKATDTHSEYVILIFFPLHQWLRERAPGLRLRTLPILLCFVPVLRSGLWDRHGKQ